MNTVLGNALRPLKKLLVKGKKLPGQAKRHPHDLNFIIEVYKHYVQKKPL
jgi:hypothetical protein